MIVIIFISTKHENLFSWLAKKCHKNSKIVNIKRPCYGEKKERKKEETPEIDLVYCNRRQDPSLSLIEVFI